MLIFFDVFMMYTFCVSPKFIVAYYFSPQYVIPLDSSSVIHVLDFGILPPPGIPHFEIDLYFYSHGIFYPF